MCSHEEITWKAVRNVVVRRMVDNSLTHKFLPSQKIRKRTKLFNAEIKKRGIIKNYEQYVKMKTSVLRKVVNDYDTDDSDNLSDIDYSIIYNSESKLSEYRCKDPTKMFTSDEDEEVNRAMNKMKKNSKTKSVKKNTKKLVNIEQDSLSLICVTSNENDNDEEKNQAMSKKKNSKVKPVKKNTKKPVDIGQQENFFSQVYFTSNKDSNDKEKSQAMRKIKNSKTKPLEKSMKTSVNIGWHTQEDFTTQALFTDDDNVNDKKENPIILKKKKNNKTKPSEKKTKKSVNIGWQEVVKKNRSMTHISDTRQCTDTLNINKQSISQTDKCNNSKADSNRRSLSPKLESQNSIVSCTAKSVSKDIPQNHSNLITVVPESDCQSDSPNSVASYKVEAVDKDTTTQNHEDSKAVANETNFETKCQDNAVACKMNPEEETVIQKEFEVLHSSPINNPSSSVSKRLPNVSKDRSCEKPTKMEENSISAKNYDDACVSPQPARLIDNVKRNLAFVLDTVDCPHQTSSPDASHDQQKDSGIDEDSQDKFIKGFGTENLDNTENIVQKISVSPEHEETNEVTEEMQENYTNDINLKVDDDSLKEQDITDNIETQIQEAQVSEMDDSPEINQIDAKVNGADDIAEGSCNVQEKQLKIMSTEIVNTRYRIVIEKDNDMNVTHEDTKCNPLPVKFQAPSCSSIINDDIDACVEMTNEIPIAQQVVNHEEDEEEDDAARCVLPQTKKQLQRHEQLNLIVDSNSSESESENRSVVERSSKIVHMNDSDASHCVEDNSEDETIRDGASRKIDTDTSCSDATYKDARAPLKDDEESRASKKNDADASHGEDSRERLCEQREKKLENDERSRASEESGIDISHDKDNREDAGGEERLGSDKRNSASEKKHNGLASEDGRNAGDEGSQRQDRASSCELETQNVCYRPHNLEELVEDEELLVETLPASMTLADINEDEEVFILNIPNKVLQCNLQGQQMILKEKTIRFGKSKFRVHNQVSTVSCVFATGKRRKPYKIVNLKEISTVTVRERLSNFAEKSTELDSRGIDTFPVRKSKKRRYILSSDDDMDNRQTDESKSKKFKITNFYRPRRRDND